MSTTTTSADAFTAYTEKLYHELACLEPEQTASDPENVNYIKKYFDAKREMLAFSTRREQ